jgi:hypothetical protein
MRIKHHHTWVVSSETARNPTTYAYYTDVEALDLSPNGGTLTPKVTVRLKLTVSGVDEDYAIYRACQYIDQLEGRTRSPKEQEACPDCHGGGLRDRQGSKCRRCDGEGLVERQPLIY